MSGRLRNGRRVPIHLYWQEGPEPRDDGDPPVGTVWDQQLALDVVEAYNARNELRTDDSEMEQVLCTENRLRRARLATDLLIAYKSRMEELARVRRDTLLGLVEDGWTNADIARALKVSPARVSQIIGVGRRACEVRGSG